MRDGSGSVPRKRTKGAMVLSNVGARAFAVGTALCVVAGGFAAAGMAAAAPGCEVDYLVQNKWQGGFSAGVTIKNLGDPVDGWRLAWTFPGSERYGDGWNATFAPSGADVVACNVDWNRAILAGGNVSFGFNGAVPGSEVGEPDASTRNCILGSRVR